jgi:tripartite-type tricarboxylate transporter receptor subunit TctC
MDVMARFVAQQSSSRMGQPVVVDNRGGAGGTFGSKAIAVADPRGEPPVFVCNPAVIDGWRSRWSHA